MAEEETREAKDGGPLALEIAGWPACLREAVRLRDGGRGAAWKRCVCEGFRNRERLACGQVCAAEPGGEVSWRFS